MRAETPEKNSKLRRGYTTGACATATSLAAATLLLEGRTLTSIDITLPQQKLVSFSLSYCRPSSNKNGACSATIKDAGDDPDVTHEAEIVATVKLTSEAGVVFIAGVGVGTVTRAGLAIAIGEPAINPVPREMIRTHLGRLALQTNYNGGFEVTIAVTNGVEIAKKTMNARLGIIGGLSILGTTGIVKPFSCSAYIASIHQGMDVAMANGIKHIAVCTGSSSERAIHTQYSLSDMAIIEMGDYVGAVLKHYKNVSFSKISIIGGFGKLSKLANGDLNLHSQKSRIDFHQYAKIVAQFDASPFLRDRILRANTSAEVLEICAEQSIPIADKICSLALVFVKSRLINPPQLECITINKSGHIIGRVGGE